MKHKHAFYKARQIDSSLKGENWPERLTVLQIVNLHNSDNKAERRALLSHLEDSSMTDLIDFDAVSARFSWSYGVLADMVGGSNEKEMTSSHSPESGWSEFWNGLKPGDVKDLSKHLCGCEAKCTLEKVFDNGLPKQWVVKGAHLDGLRIEFTCWGLPLISAKKYKDFCDDNGVVIPDGSYLNNWINAEQELLPKDKKQTETAKIGGADRDPVNLKKQHHNTRATRTNQLHCFIWRVYQHLLKKSDRVTAQKVWDEIRHRHKAHDEEEIIQEVTAKSIEWFSRYKNEQILKRSSFDKTLSNLKENPPF